MRYLNDHVWKWNRRGKSTPVYILQFYVTSVMSEYIFQLLITFDNYYNLILLYVSNLLGICMFVWYFSVKELSKIIIRVINYINVSLMVDLYKKFAIA